MVLYSALHTKSGSSALKANMATMTMLSSIAQHKTQSTAGADGNDIGFVL